MPENQAKRIENEGQNHTNFGLIRILQDRTSCWDNAEWNFMSGYCGVELHVEILWDGISYRDNTGWNFMSGYYGMELLVRIMRNGTTCQDTAGSMGG